MDSLDKHRIHSILEKNPDMTIATVREDGFPQANTVSFVNDGLMIYFGTGKSSQKAANIKKNEKVSLAITSPYHFWKDIEGLSISGYASVVDEPAEYRKVGKLLTDKYPLVHEFADTASENIMIIKVDPQQIFLLDYSVAVGHTKKYITSSEEESSAAS